MAVANKPHNKDAVQEMQPMERLDPPSTLKSSIKDPILLVVQLIIFIFSFMPILIRTAIIKLFYTKPKSVRGKVVLVTGSARGLGRGFVEKFAQLGCKVACVDVNVKENEETVAAVNEKFPGCAKAYECNVVLSDEISKLKQTVKKDLGDVNILVHNAGIVAGLPITEGDEVYLHGIIAVNLTSHFLMIREFLPDMTQRNEGHIVSVASIAGFGGLANGSIYCATKHGVVGLMECLHYELEEIPNNKVKTSVVCPYFINTSSFYTKFWDLRLPELSIQEAVDAAVNGILKNQRLITIPTRIYYACHFFKLLPDSLNDVLRKIFYVKLTVPPYAEQKNTPIYKVLMESVQTTESLIKKYA